ncbi:phage tail tube protein [Streptomyces caniferus]|uniref:phage tail tube protein n=1 Tax=Streptomyces caniferus TaxID=285557 RepID=UPI003807CEFE
MTTPTPPVLEDGLRNDLIRKQLMQAVYAADYSASAVSAPFNTTDGTLAAIPTGYVPVGYTTDDGVTFTGDLSMTDVTSSQAVEPTRSDVESDVLSAQYAAQETNQATVALFEGLPLSGTGALPAIGSAWQWDRPAIPKNPYRRLLFVGLDYNDSGEEIYVIRFFPRARLTSRDDEQWARSTETQRPVTFTAYRDPVLKTPCRNWVDGPGWRAFAPPSGG